MSTGPVNRGRTITLERADWIAAPGRVEPLLRWDRSGDGNCGDGPVYLHLRRDPPNEGDLDAIAGIGAHADVLARVKYGVGAAQRELFCSVGRIEVLALPSDYVQIDVSLETIDKDSWPAVDVTAHVLPYPLARPTLPRRTVRSNLLRPGDTQVFQAPQCARYIQVYSTPLAATGTLVRFLGGSTAVSRTLGIMDLTPDALAQNFAEYGIALPVDTQAVEITNDPALEDDRTFEVQWLLGT